MDPLQQQLKLLLLSSAEENLMAAYHTDEAPTEELWQRYTSSPSNFAAGGGLDGNESAPHTPPPHPSPYTPPSPCGGERAMGLRLPQTNWLAINLMLCRHEVKTTTSLARHWVKQQQQKTMGTAGQSQVTAAVRKRSEEWCCSVGGFEAVFFVHE